ncbi:MAG: hypothetical protein MMC23_007559 [Stictis urceolatum]|nr:hypothetical protein [Stictis urceolata]
MVDLVVSNYIFSNNQGDGTPNITDGFDRTFGPQYYYFNKGSPFASLADLRTDTLLYASPLCNTAFYDSIAEYYWADLATDGSVKIPRVKAGNYRLTVYAGGIFGQYTQDGIKVSAGGTTQAHARWREDNSVWSELWRFVVPDKSSEEYRHGYAEDPAHPLYPAEYRLYWPVHDFVDDFPGGLNPTVSRSDLAKDCNYIQWSGFWRIRKCIRTKLYNKNVNN